MKKVLVASILVTLVACGEKNTSGNDGVIPGNSIKKEYLETESKEHAVEVEKKTDTVKEMKDSVQEKDSTHKK